MKYLWAANIWLCKLCRERFGSSEKQLDLISYLFAILLGLLLSVVLPVILLCLLPSWL